MKALPSSVILAISVSIAVVRAQDWTYEGQTGPENWGGFCKGQSQSPIDIPRNNISTVTEEPLVFSNYDRTPDKSYLRNTGSTVKYQSTYKEWKYVPKVSGGGLPGEYAFGQFHLHWGTKDSVGSEHTINKVSYPMELHLVHYKTEYGKDLSEAIAGGKGKSDTLAVLGIMFKLQNKHNSDLQPILQVIKQIMQPNTKEYVKLFPLETLLPRDLSTFYRYNGSLTTPGCNEIVVWTVFKDTINVSRQQMEQLRALYKTSPVARNNFRPVQPLNGRRVVEVQTDESGSSGLDRLTGVTVTLMTLLFQRLVL